MRYSLFSDHQKLTSIDHFYLLGLLIFSITLFFASRLSTTHGDLNNDFSKDYSVELDAILINRSGESYRVSKYNGHSTYEQLLQTDQSINVHKSSKKTTIHIYEIIDIEKENKRKSSLLTIAKALYESDKLTTPIGNNAFEYYETVIAMDAANAEALQGISNIVDRYILLADSAKNNKQKNKVVNYVKKAYKVGWKYIEMQLLLQKYADYIDDGTVFFNIALSDSSVKNQEATSGGTVENVEDDQAIIHVDQQTAFIANQLMHMGDTTSAKIVLKNFVAISGDYWGHSYDLLLKRYLDDSDYQSAELLLNQNGALDVFSLAERTARIFIARDDIDGALWLLESYSPVIGDYPEYYALKAALYYKKSMYQQSVKYYRELLSQQENNSRYWLGLAVSLDALDDAEADIAYQSANHYADQVSVISRFLGQQYNVAISH